MKKESVSSAVKKMMSALKSMVKRKTRALKARLIIYSLLAQSNFLAVSSSSVPLTPTTLTHHCQLQAQADEAHAEEAHAEEAHAQADHVATTGGASVIEMVKHSKEEAGEEFSLEKDIDHVADLFIRNFHRQMRMQKQNSLNRYQNQMLSDGTL